MTPNYYPPISFSFKVEFLDVEGMNTDREQCFLEVSGLNFTIETEEFSEGGENRFSYKLPQRIKYPNLKLKRGLITDSAIIKWINKAADSFFTVVDYSFAPSDILISLLNEAGEPAAVWLVIQAYPVRWEVSDFNANGNDIAIETIELAYQYFKRQL